MRKGANSFIVVYPSLVERLEYDIKVADNGGIYQINGAEKIIINIQDTGNTLEFRKKKSPTASLYVIPLKDIETTTTIIEEKTTRMVLGRKDNLLLEMLISKNNELDSDGSGGNVDAVLAENCQNDRRSVFCHRQLYSMA